MVLRTLPAWGVFTKLVEDNIKGHPRPALSHHTTTSCQPRHSAALGAGNKAWGLDDPVKVDGQWQCRVKYPALLRAGDGYAWEYVSDMPPFMARYTNGYSGPAPVNIFRVLVRLPSLCYYEGFPQSRCKIATMDPSNQTQMQYVCFVVSFGVHIYVYSYEGSKVGKPAKRIGLRFDSCLPMLCCCAQDHANVRKDWSPFRRL